LSFWIGSPRDRPDDSFRMLARSLPDLRTNQEAPTTVPAATGAEISILNPLEDPEWEAKLAGFAQASCFHTSGWARILHETYGYKPAYFAAKRLGDVVALLPVMSVTSWLTGRRGVSLPFTDSCELLHAPGENCQKIIQASLHHAVAESWDYLEFRSGGAFPSGVPESVGYFVHCLSLRGGEESLWAGLDGTVRTGIRKAREHRVTVSQEGDIGALRAFYELHCLTRKRLGVPPQPFLFFVNIQRYLMERNLASLFLASYRGKPVAGAIFLHFGTQVMFKFGASDRGYQHLRANNLIMWEAIRKFSGSGFCDLHMGRNETDNPGLRRFKLGWGACEERLSYFRYSPRVKAFIDGTNPQQRWHHTVFRRIPVPIARIIGAAVYPHMA
jgi:Acetyltransferase (GNAT) domain